MDVRTTGATDSRSGDAAPLRLPAAVNRNAAWSDERDRAHHDWLFSHIDRDRLNVYYSGYVTIKRFGDLVAPYLASCSRVLDVGCGPGEITCYLAQRFPDVTFLGIDHSAVGVKKARKNAKRLGLTNARFEARDLFGAPAVDPCDIVLFLDSFHHFQDPPAVIRAVRRIAPRLLLLEPHGDDRGQWVRAIDFDWINTELQRIRRLVNRLVGDEDAATIEVDDPATAGCPPSSHDAATEYRYPPEFYESLLQGLDVEVRGTISGLTTYLDNLYEKTASNAFFNRLCIELFEAIDARLHASGVDILAKHWIIYAETPGTSASGRFAFDGFARYRAHASTALAPAGVADDFYAVTWAGCDIPAHVTARSEFSVRVHVINHGSGVWSSSDPRHPVNLGYHWRELNRKVLLFEGVRTSLGGKPMGPHECAVAEMRVVAPDQPGCYLLQVDIVREDDAWFSERDQPTVEREVIVDPAV